MQAILGQDGTLTLPPDLTRHFAPGPVEVTVVGDELRVRHAGAADQRRLDELLEQVRQLNLTEAEVAQEVAATRAKKH